MVIEKIPRRELYDLQDAFSEEHEGDLIPCWGERHLEDMFDLFSLPKYKKDSPKTFKALKQLRDKIEFIIKKDIEKGIIEFANKEDEFIIEEIKRLAKEEKRGTK